MPHVAANVGWVGKVEGMRRIVSRYDFERIIALYCSVFKARAQVMGKSIFGIMNENGKIFLKSYLELAKVALMLLSMLSFVSAHSAHARWTAVYSSGWL
jgi:hypothetical protein